MEMKEIALKFCNLPDGEYIIKSNLGDIKTIISNPNEKNYFKTVQVFINNELYDEIIYSNFDYCHLWEIIYLKNNEQKYVLKRELFENTNEIRYTSEDNETFGITNGRIYNCNIRSFSRPYYYIEKELFFRHHTDDDDILFVYNLDKDEKILRIRKDNTEILTAGNSIPVKGDIYKFISKYNELINMINSNIKIDISHYNEFSAYTSKVHELFKPNFILKIDLEEVKKLDEELNRYIKVYKEYAPKLNKPHSPEILEVLSMVATDLNDIFNTPLHNKKSNNKQKMFNLSKYKNK